MYIIAIECEHSCELVTSHALVNDNRSIISLKIYLFRRMKKAYAICAFEIQ